MTDTIYWNSLFANNTSFMIFGQIEMDRQWVSVEGGGFTWPKNHTKRWRTGREKFLPRHNTRLIVKNKNTQKRWAERKREAENRIFGVSFYTRIENIYERVRKETARNTERVIYSLRILKMTDLHDKQYWEWIQLVVAA